MFWDEPAGPSPDRFTTTSTSFILWFRPFMLSALILAKSSSDLCRPTLLLPSSFKRRTVAAPLPPAEASRGDRRPPALRWWRYFLRPRFMASLRLSPSPSISLSNFLRRPSGLVTLSSSSPSSLLSSSSSSSSRSPMSGSNSGRNLIGGGSSMSWKSTLSSSSSTPTPPTPLPALFLPRSSSKHSRHSAAASRICFTPALERLMAAMIAWILPKM
mmetsp:Transcript_29253/g.55258  ORF Transcript_29253/g.55258 Transcript_29253/m.55258 type:complete len:215 (+) Transcript_29253:510-1154(+)